MTISGSFHRRGGGTRALALVGVAIGALMLSAQAAGAVVALVDFDPPGTVQGPSTYVAAGARQVISTTPATFSGGVVLGFATFFPAISFATAPDVYGTADFGDSLANALTIGVNAGFAANEVSFALFNGETFAQSYTATAFDGATAVASQTLTNIDPNFEAGYEMVDLQAADITSVTITPVGAPPVWDFLIDTVAFNQSVQQGVSTLPPPASPPPSVFVPPAPVTISDDHGHETELQLDYGDTRDGKGTMNAIKRITPPITVQPPPIVVLPPITPIISPIPEPTTWAVMLTGFGSMGALQRRRRDQVA